MPNDTSRPASADHPVHLDHTRPMSERVHDLLARLTLEEKIQLMGDKTPGVPRMGIPAYTYWSEALHGLRAAVELQCFHRRSVWQPPGMLSSSNGWRPLLAARAAPNTMLRYVEAGTPTTIKG